ncbi:hypothetical protein DSUL_140103 [Desulfovibrionales bacterium]
MCACMQWWHWRIHGVSEIVLVDNFKSCDRRNLVELSWPSSTVFQLALLTWCY